jgi:biotin synthase-like enzyme
MKDDAEIFAEAEHAARAGATRYGMVLSGRGPLSSARETREPIRGGGGWPIEVCLSVGS